MGLFKKLFNSKEKNSQPIQQPGEPINIGSSALNFVELTGGTFTPKTGIYAGNEIHLNSFKIAYRPIPASIISGGEEMVHFEKESENLLKLSLNNILNTINQINKISEKEFRLPTDIEWHYCELMMPEIFGEKNNYNTPGGFSDFCIVADAENKQGLMTQKVPKDFNISNIITINSLRDFRNVTPQTKALCRLVIVDNTSNQSENSTISKVDMLPCNYDASKYINYQLNDIVL